MGSNQLFDPAQPRETVGRALIDRTKFNPVAEGWAMHVRGDPRHPGMALAMPVDEQRCLDYRNRSLSQGAENRLVGLRSLLHQA
jgi:hypothetical protein